MGCRTCLFVAQLGFHDKLSTVVICSPASLHDIPVSILSPFCNFGRETVAHDVHETSCYQARPEFVARGSSEDEHVCEELEEKTREDGAESEKDYRRHQQPLPQRRSKLCLQDRRASNWPNTACDKERALTNTKFTARSRNNTRNGAMIDHLSFSPIFRQIVQRPVALIPLWAQEKKLEAQGQRLDHDKNFSDCYRGRVTRSSERTHSSSWCFPSTEAQLFLHAMYSRTASTVRDQRI